MFQDLFCTCRGVPRVNLTGVVSKKRIDLCSSRYLRSNNVCYMHLCRLRSPNNPPLASADMMLLNPPSVLKSSSSVGGSDTPTPQKKHSSVDNLRLQGKYSSSEVTKLWSLRLEPAYC